MKLSKVRMLGISVLLLSAMAMSVFAYEYVTSQQIPTGIVITTPTLEIGIYRDSACTYPVTVIDFGEIPQPSYDSQLDKTLYIRNEGDVPLTIYWNSTLSLVTDEITEIWFTNGTYLGVGDYRSATYRIYLPQYVTIGTYDWALTIWGEY